MSYNRGRKMRRFYGWVASVIAATGLACVPLATVAVAQLQAPPTPSAPDINAPKAPDVSAPKAPDVSAPKAPDVSAPKAPDVSAPKAPDVSAPKTPDVNAPMLPDANAPKLPPADAPQPVNPPSQPGASPPATGNLGNDVDVRGRLPRGTDADVDVRGRTNADIDANRPGGRIDADLDTRGRTGVDVDGRRGNIDVDVDGRGRTGVDIDGRRGGVDVDGRGRAGFDANGRFQGARLGVDVFVRDGGLWIHDVVPDSVAFRAGLRQRDVIVSVNGVRIRTHAELVRHLHAAARADGRVMVRYWRGDDLREADVLLTEYEVPVFEGRQESYFRGPMGNGYSGIEVLDDGNDVTIEYRGRRMRCR
jgi:hypothetical protein